MHTDTPTPLFIALEGTEGAGKSTQAGLLCAWLRTLGHTVVHTHEPGGCAEAQDIRTLLKDPEKRWSVDAETLLFAAARNASYTNIVQPALDAGHTVVSDRSIFSSLAMQGHHPSDMEKIISLHRTYNQDLWPDVTLYLEAPTHDTLARARARHGAGGDRIEQRAQAFFERVNHIMANLASTPTALQPYGIEHVPTILRVDATGDIDTVFERTRNALSTWMLACHKG